MIFAFCSLWILNYFDYDRHSVISEGGNHSWSQQFAAWNNGITRDANTNKLHILESTQMKEQQQQQQQQHSDRELKPEDESPVQLNHNLPQNHLQPDGLSENPSHVPQATDLQSRNNSISMEQPVGSVNLGPTQLQVGELFRLLRPQVDKDRGKQLNTLFYKFKVGFYIHGMTQISH